MLATSRALLRVSGEQLFPGAYAAADSILRESLAAYREHGLKDRVAGALNLLGDLAQLAGDHEQATARYQESLALWRELRGTGDRLRAAQARPGQPVHPRPRHRIITKLDLRSRTRIAVWATQHGLGPSQPR